MRIRALALLAAAIWLSPVSAAFQSFDAACQAAMPSYYAALLASARGDADGTTRQLLLLGARVKELAARTDAPPWAAGAEPVMTAVAARVEAARQRTLARDLAAAHASLERVRYLLREARARHGVRTFDDAITDYHEVMERLTSRVGLHNEIMLAAEDYQAIQEQSARAVKAWTEIDNRAAAERPLAGWSSVAAATRKQLATLQKAAVSQDADLAQTTAEGLKNSYYDMLRVLARATS